MAKIGRMTSIPSHSFPTRPSVLSTDEQRAVWFDGPPPDAAPDPAELTRLAAEYGIEILGPPPLP